MEEARRNLNNGVKRRIWRVQRGGDACEKRHDVSELGGELGELLLGEGEERGWREIFRERGDGGVVGARREKRRASYSARESRRERLRRSARSETRQWMRRRMQH